MPTAERYHQYQILRREDGSLWELGRGSMGITYKAFDTNLRFTVALKVINSAYLESDTARQRFLREARAAAGLQHPNVALVFNLGTEQEKFYYVMEFIDGETVDARVKRLGHLEPVEALKIALQVARALAVAAKQQLVHRDLKPTNLMLVDQEGESIVKVIDFGLAKIAKDSGEDSTTLTMGGFVGTPHFASPEQVEEGEVDIRSDIYSLGATLYFVLTGESPFSGSVGQVMSQHLYKALPMERLTALPRSVVSLLQQMMEKDRNHRPQTPQDLQKAILACLEEIRAAESRRVNKPDEQSSAFETLDLSLPTGQPLAPGAVLAQNYKLIDELSESPPGRRFLADDRRRQRRVSVLVLSSEFLSDGARLANLEQAVQQLRTAPHPMLREVYSFETVADCSFLVEECVVGPSLLDLIRTRSVLSAPEVLRLLGLLAPLADHATNHQLQHLDLTLLGIHLTSPASTESGTRPDFLQRSLTAWNPFAAKVDAIDFSFLPSNTATWAGSATRMGGAAGGGQRSSLVRMLSLLAYELLGGPRTKLESTGQYTPIAALTQEGNLALRRALVDGCPTAGKLVEQLAAVIGTKGPAPPLSAMHAPSEPLPRLPPPVTPLDSPTKRKITVTGLRLVLAIGLTALLAIGSYAIYHLIASRPTAEIAALSVHSEPTGASILLDGAPPPQPPGTFTHVGFGKHQLSASLDGYFPFTRDIQVQTGMNPTIPVVLQPIPPPVEIAALTVKTEPAGASVLLDGKPPQQPPGTFTHVGFGKHQLSASLDGHLPFARDIQVRSGMNPTIPVILDPLPPSVEIAALTVTTDPSGASVLLDGKLPQQPPATFTHVRFGRHPLTAFLVGHEPVTQDLEVRAQMEPAITLKLPPADGDSPQYLTAYVRFVQSLKASGATNFSEHLEKLASIIDQLHNRTSPLTSDEFRLFYKKSMTDAANKDLDILPAMLLLGENAANDSEAMKWFEDAVNRKNDSYAMMKLGRLYLKKRTSDDSVKGREAKGYELLRQAYEKGNLEAGAYLGECLLYGLGTKQDWAQGEKLITSLANQNQVQAMVILGGIRQGQADYKRAKAKDSTEAIGQGLNAQAGKLESEARQWWEKSAAKGNYYALAHLGQMIEEGIAGYEKNEEEAEKRYQEGIRHGNSLSMFYYGLMLRKKPDRQSESETWIGRAAAMGLAAAISWLGEHQLPIPEKKIDSELQ